MKKNAALLLLATCGMLAAQVITTQSFNRYAVVNVELVNGKLEVTHRVDPGYRYSEGGRPPDILYKDIYCASNGVVIFEKKIIGKIVPEKTIPEKILWETKDGIISNDAKMKEIEDFYNLDRMAWYGLSLR
jgi:hypothetical protein